MFYGIDIVASIIFIGIVSFSASLLGFTDEINKKLLKMLLATTLAVIFSVLISSVVIHFTVDEAKYGAIYVVKATIWKAAITPIVSALAVNLVRWLSHVNKRDGYVQSNHKDNIIKPNNGQDK